MSAMPQVDRRSPAGDLLAEALLRASAPVHFADLAAAAPEAEVRDVSAWLGHALDACLVEEIDDGWGERGFRLRARGRRVLGAERRIAA